MMMYYIIAAAATAATIVAAGIYWILWIEEPAQLERMRKIKREIY